MSPKYLLNEISLKAEIWTSNQLKFKRAKLENKHLIIIINIGK